MASARIFSNARKSLALRKMRRRPLARLSTWYTYPPNVIRSGLDMSAIVRHEGGPYRENPRQCHSYLTPLIHTKHKATKSKIRWDRKNGTGLALTLCGSVTSCETGPCSRIFFRLVSLVLAGYGFMKHATNRDFSNICVDASVWWMYHGFRVAARRPAGN